MYYQVSCRVWYDDFGLRNAALARLLNQYKIKAFLRNRDSEDYVWPAQVGKYEDPGYEPPDGPYELHCRLRMESQADRDEVVIFLIDEKSNINLTIVGHIEKHDCYHSEGGGCQNQIILEWGVA